MFPFSLPDIFKGIKREHREEKDQRSSTRDIGKKVSFTLFFWLQSHFERNLVQKFAMSATYGQHISTI